jgi:hypothetical protein
VLGSYWFIAWLALHPSETPENTASHAHSFRCEKIATHAALRECRSVSFACSVVATKQFEVFRVASRIRHAVKGAATPYSLACFSLLAPEF